MPLTREQLTAWTNALRDNPEQQITNQLSTDGETGFCCLGKLCQVLGVSGAHVTVDLTNEIKAFYAYEGEIRLLPKTIGDIFGCSNGEFKKLQMPFITPIKDICYHSAAEANDEGVPWLVIADHFDKHYKCLGE